MPPELRLFLEAILYGTPRLSGPSCAGHAELFDPRASETVPRVATAPRHQHSFRASDLLPLDQPAADCAPLHRATPASDGVFDNSVSPAHPTTAHEKENA